MLPLRAEWANVARTVVYETMSNHFVLALKAFAAFSTRTALY